MKADPTRLRRILLGAFFVVVATLIWLPLVHVFFSVDAKTILENPGLSPRAQAMAARHLDLWLDATLRERELKRMRRSNAEWDFMGRTYLVLALVNMSFRQPELKPKALEAIDRIVEETLRLEKENGFYFFSMPYARDRPFEDQPARSLFVDGEIALMLGSRRLLQEKEEWRPLLQERVKAIEERMRRGPVLSAESYPDECWTFDQATALAALRVADAVDGSDHRPLCREWVARAKEKLVDPSTGLLIAEFTYRGTRMGGPQGSSIWMVSHALQLVDESFARDQYDRARKELRKRVLGFDVAREWPVSDRGPQNIDSGIVVPILDASPASSGMALIGAAAFSDADFLSGLMRSLELAAFPIRKGGRLRYAASNQVGDAAMLYAIVLGPLWAEVRRRVDR